MDDSLNETQFNTIGALTKGAIFGGISAMTGASVPMSLLSAITASGILTEYGKPQTGTSTVAALNQYSKNAEKQSSSSQMIDYTAKFSDTINVLKGMNKTFMAMIDRLESNNALLEKIVGIQMGTEPINFDATARRNNRLALTMSRTAMGRITLSLMSNSIAGSYTKQQELAHKAIDAGLINEKEYLKSKIMDEIGKRFTSLENFTKQYSANLEYMNEEILQQKGVFTKETNMSITKIIPLRLQAIGNLINKSNEHLENIHDVLEAHYQMDMKYKEESIVHSLWATDFMRQSIHHYVDIANSSEGIFDTANKIGEQEREFFQKSYDFYKENITVLNSINDRIFRQSDSNYFPVKIVHTAARDRADDMKTGSFAATISNFIRGILGTKSTPGLDANVNSSTFYQNLQGQKVNQSSSIGGLLGKKIEIYSSNELGAQFKQLRLQNEKQIKAQNEKIKADNENLKLLNTTAANIYGQQVRFGSFMYKYISNIPNILTRVLNTALKFYLTFRFTRFIFNGLKTLMGITGKAKDGIWGFFERLLTPKDAVKSGISLYDRVMGWIFGKNYKDHTDMANKIEESGILITIGSFLVDQIKKGFMYLWDSGAIMTALKYYVLTKGFLQIGSSLPKFFGGILTAFGNGVVKLGAFWSSNMITRIFLGGGFITFFGGLFGHMSKLLGVLFKHADLITFASMAFKHMFDNWFSMLNEDTKNAFSKLNFGEKVVFTIKHMFGGIWEWLQGTKAAQLVNEYMKDGFGGFISRIWNSLTEWFSENWQYILAFSIGSAAGSALTGHPLIGAALGGGAALGFDILSGNNAFENFFNKNIKWWETDAAGNTTDSARLKLAETERIKSNVKDPQLNELIKIGINVAESAGEIKKEFGKVIENTQNIKESASSLWTSFKKTFFDVLKPTAFGSFLGGVRNFFNNIAHAIAPDTMDKYYKKEAEIGEKSIQSLLQVANLQQKWGSSFVNGALINKEELDQFISDIQNARENNQNLDEVLKNNFNIDKKDSAGILGFKLAAFNGVNTNYNAAEIAKAIAQEQNEARKQDTEQLAQAVGSAGSAAAQGANDAGNIVKQALETKMTEQQNKFDNFFNIRAEKSGFIEGIRKSFFGDGAASGLLQFAHGSGTHSSFSVTIANDEYNEVMKKVNSQFDPIVRSEIKDLLTYNQMNEDNIKPRIDDISYQDFSDYDKVREAYGASSTISKKDWKTFVLENPSIHNGSKPTGIISSQDYYKSMHKYKDNNDIKQILQKLYANRTLQNSNVVMEKIDNQFDSSKITNNKDISSQLFDHLINIDDLKFFNSYEDGNISNDDLNAIKKSFIDNFLRKYKTILTDGYNTYDNSSPLFWGNDTRISRSKNNSNIFKWIIIPLIDSLTSEDIKGNNKKDIFNKLLAPIIAMNSLVTISRESFLFHLMNELGIENKNDYSKLIDGINDLESYDKNKISEGFVYPEDFFGHMFINSIKRKINFHDLYSLLMNPNGEVYNKFESLFKKIGINYGNALKNTFNKNTFGFQVKDEDSVLKFLGYLANITGGESNRIGYEKDVLEMYKNLNIETILKEAIDPTQNFGDPTYLQFTSSNQLLNIGDEVHYNKLNPLLRNNLENYAKDYYDRYGRKVVVTSGYRSFAEQSYLYNKKLNGQLDAQIAPPSMNNRHLLGLGVDISLDSIDPYLLSKNNLMQPDIDDPYHIEMKNGNIHNRFAKINYRNLPKYSFGDPSALSGIYPDINGNYHYYSNGIRTDIPGKYDSDIENLAKKAQIKNMATQDALSYIASLQQEQQKKSQGKVFATSDGKQLTPEQVNKLYKEKKYALNQSALANERSQYRRASQWTMAKSQLANERIYYHNYDPSISYKNDFESYKNMFKDINLNSSTIKLSSDDLKMIEELEKKQSELTLKNLVIQASSQKNNGYVSTSMLRELKNLPEWSKYIIEASKLTGIDAELLSSLIKVESNGNPLARSKYAYGLTQIIPSTWNGIIKNAISKDPEKYKEFSEWKNKYSEFSTKGTENTRAQILLGAYYLMQLKHGNPDFDWIDVLRAYNAGSGRVKQYKAANINRRDIWKLTKEQKIAAGIPEKHDARQAGNYPGLVMQYYGTHQYVPNDTELNAEILALRDEAIAQTDPNSKGLNKSLLNSPSSQTAIEDILIKLSNGKELSKVESQGYLRWWNFIDSQLRSYGYDDETMKQWSLIDKKLKEGMNVFKNNKSEDRFYKLNPVLRYRFLQYATAFKNAHSHPVTVTSTYRSKEEQTKLYNERQQAMKRGEKVLPADRRSLHTLGMAIDISSKDSIDDKLLNQYGLYRPMPNTDPVHVELIETQQFKSMNGRYDKIHDAYGGFPEMLEKNILDSNIYDIIKNNPSNSSKSSGRNGWDPLSGFFNETSNVIEFYIELLRKASEKYGNIANNENNDGPILKRMNDKAPFWRNSYNGIFPKSSTSYYNSIFDKSMYQLIDDNTKTISEINDNNQIGDPIFSNIENIAKSFMSVIPNGNDIMNFNFKKPSVINSLEKHVNRMKGTIKGKVVPIFKNNELFDSLSEKIFNKEIETLKWASKQNALQFKDVNNDKLEELKDELKDIKVSLVKVFEENKIILESLVNTTGTALKSAISSVGQVINNVTSVSNNSMNANNSMINENQSGNNSMTATNFGSMDAFLCF